MKTVYFVRHGSTEGNESDAYQHVDIPLSKRGMEQAEVLAEKFVNVPLDIIVSSDMPRALMTAETISKKTKVRLVSDPLFREILRPLAVRGRSKEDSEVKEIMNQIKTNYVEKPDWHYSDEENYEDLKARGIKALAYIDGLKEENILVATHGHFMRMMLALIVMGEDCTPKVYKNFLSSFYISNTGVTICQTYEGKLSVHTWNYYGQLDKKQ